MISALVPSDHVAAPALADSGSAGGVIGTVVAIIVIALVIVGGYIAQKKRAEQLQRFARAKGLTYEKRNDAWAQMDWGHPFGVGRAQKARHVMTGHLSGRPVVTFAHEYTTGSGDDRRTVHTMVTAIQIPRAFPKLEVGLEGVTGRFARKLGFKDVELESEAFNRKYKIQCDNRKFAYDVLHPRFMEWMTAIDSNGFTIAGPYVVIHRSGRLKEHEIDSNFGYISAVIEHMPGFVWANSR